jgi:hypothetical protein
MTLTVKHEMRHTDNKSEKKLLLLPVLQILSSTGQVLLKKIMNTARANKLRLSIHVKHNKCRAYEHFNKLTLTHLMIYLTGNKFNLQTFHLKHFSKNTLGSQAGVSPYSITLVD